MSKQKAKGTAWETELLPLLQLVFGPQVERSPLKGVNDRGDFQGVPYLIEAKKTDVPRFLEWAKTAAKKVTDGRFAVIWAGDRRKGDGPFVLLPLAHFLELAADSVEQRRRLAELFGGMPVYGLTDDQRVDL